MCASTASTVLAYPGTTRIVAYARDTVTMSDVKEASASVEAGEEEEDVASRCVFARILVFSK